MIVIVDYDMGNCGSIANMIKHVSDGRAVVKISNEKSILDSADGIILPGVGAFDNGIRNLQKYNLIEILNGLVLNKKIKILGICLGMQIMTNRSEEGVLPGLGWINADTIKFNLDATYKIPHVGWNYVSILEHNGIFKNVDDDFKFYFVHSYYTKCIEEVDIISETSYGIDFTSSFQRENIYGVQFHPEKSHKYGMKIIQNFLEL